MLFSREKWNDAKELQKFLKASSATSFESCMVAFQAAEDKFLLPILGQDMMEDAISLYHSNVNDSIQADLVSALQSAECHLAFADNFDEFQIRLTDQGIQRQETEKFKQAYRYQEHAMQKLYYNRGFNALERAIRILEEYEEVFQRWNRSEYYRARKTFIVRSPSEVSQYYFINNSYIIYLRLLPYFRTITDLSLPQVIGRDLHHDFLAALSEGSMYVKEDLKTLTIEEFRKSIVPYVVFTALAKLIRETGSITDRGLYFDSVKATAPNPDEETPASRSQIAAVASSLEDNAYRYATALRDIIKNSFPSYFGGHDCDVYSRDNRHKRMCWL